MNKDRFPACVLIDFGNVDSAGFPEISEATAFREPLTDFKIIFSDEEACRYIRADIVENSDTELVNKLCTGTDKKHTKQLEDLHVVIQELETERNVYKEALKKILTTSCNNTDGIAREALEYAFEE